MDGTTTDSVVVDSNIPASHNELSYQDKSGETYFTFDSIGLLFTVVALVALMILFLVSYQYLRSAILTLVDTAGEIISGGAVTVAEIAVKVVESIQEITVFVVNRTADLIIAITNAVAIIANGLASAVTTLANELAVVFGAVLGEIETIAPVVLQAVETVINGVLNAITAAMIGGDVDPFGFVPGVFTIFAPLFDIRV